METKMKAKEFFQTCKENASIIGHQGLSYFEFHRSRFYATYKTCCDLIKPGSRILSIGAGSAYVESVLAQEYSATVTVVDFPEAIDMNLNYYNKLGFDFISIDITNDDLIAQVDGLDTSFDLLISAEIIEHIPEPPINHFKKFGRWLDKTGHIVVTTPNMGSLIHVAKVILMRPILPPPEKTFAPVCFENEGAHRREYMPSEIVDALGRAGFGAPKITYSWNYQIPRSFAEVLAYPARYTIPRLRPTMIVVGSKMQKEAKACSMAMH